MGVITIHNKKLFTLFPDGSEYHELDPETEFDQNAIGEYKKLEISCSSTQAVANSVIYFSPALFFNLSGLSPYVFGGIPPEAYVYAVDSAATIGWYTMQPSVSISSNAELCKNWDVQIFVGYGNDFKIVIKFYHFEDRGAYFGSSNQYNHNKLLKDRVGSPSELTVSGESVYTTTKQGVKGYIFQQSVEDKGVFSYKEFQLENYKASFYNKSAHQTAPYFSNPVWDLTVGGDPVSKLSTLENTKVGFTIDTPTTVNDIFVWAIRTDTFDNTVNFRDNYEASFADVTNAIADGVTADNKIIGEGSSVSVGGGQANVTFHINKDLLIPGQKYRFVAVVYYNESEYKVNSFISDEEYVADVPYFNGVGYGLTAKLQDYFNEWTGNDLSCVVEERIRSIINVNYNYFGFTNDIEARLGIAGLPNDIRRYLVKVTTEIYHQQSSQLRNYLDRKIAYKINPVTYSVPEGMELNFTDGNLEIIYGWRNRYEDNTLNIESTINDVIIAPASTQDWAGKRIVIETRLELYYDDYDVPFSDELVFLQYMNVSDYDDSKRANVFITGTTDELEDEKYLCKDDTNCFDVFYSTGTSSNFRSILTIEKEPGSVAMIEESDAEEGLIDSQGTVKITDQESAFGQTVVNRAKFCLDGSEFDFDVPYKLCTIIKKFTK